MSVVLPANLECGRSYPIDGTGQSRIVMDGFASVYANTATDILLCEIIDELKAIRKELSEQKRGNAKITSD
jgi:hypothetical protein